MDTEKPQYTKDKIHDGILVVVSGPEDNPVAQTIRAPIVVFRRGPSVVGIAPLKVERYYGVYDSFDFTPDQCTLPDIEWYVRHVNEVADKYIQKMRPLYDTVMPSSDDEDFCPPNMDHSHGGSPNPVRWSTNQARLHGLWLLPERDAHLAPRICADALRLNASRWTEYEIDVAWSDDPALDRNLWETAHKAGTAEILGRLDEAKQALFERRKKWQKANEPPRVPSECIEMLRPTEPDDDKSIAMTAATVVTIAIVLAAVVIGVCMTS